MIEDDHFINVYNTKADLYDAMVRAEDYEGNLLPSLQSITSLDQKIIVDLGAGTGRVTRLIAPLAKQTIATDFTLAMLRIAANSATIASNPNCYLVQADHHALPFRTGFADVCVVGWSFAHATGWTPDIWKEEIDLFVSNMMAILKPGGTAIIIETLGTGQAQPHPPNERLAAYYTWLENEQGFASHWIRTDYKFGDVAEAQRLTSFFFGNEFGERVVQDNWSVVPECTGLWWKTKP